MEQQQMGLGEVVKQRRLKMGLSIKNLAIRSGVSASTIWSIETKSISSRDDTVSKLSKILKAKLPKSGRRRYPLQKAYMGESFGAWVGRRLRALDALSSSERGLKYGLHPSSVDRSLKHILSGTIRSLSDDLQMPIPDLMDKYLELVGYYPASYRTPWGRYRIAHSISTEKMAQMMECCAHMYHRYEVLSSSISIASAHRRFMHLLKANGHSLKDYGDWIITRSGEKISVEAFIKGPEPWKLSRKPSRGSDCAVDPATIKSIIEPKDSISPESRAAAHGRQREAYFALTTPTVPAPAPAQEYCTGVAQAHKSYPNYVWACGELGIPAVSENAWNAVKGIRTDHRAACLQEIESIAKAMQDLQSRLGRLARRLEEE
jgi:transcriptional regulator with XRE-family HTH domain